MKTARIVALLAAVLAASCAMIAAAELEPAPAAGIHIAAEDTGSRVLSMKSADQAGFVALMCGGCASKWTYGTAMTLTPFQTS